MLVKGEFLYKIGLQLLAKGLQQALPQLDIKSIAQHGDTWNQWSLLKILDTVTGLGLTESVST